MTEENLKLCKVVYRDQDREKVIHGVLESQDDEFVTIKFRDRDKIILAKHTILKIVIKDRGDSDGEY